jgi:signal transduction histidine kinase
VGIGLALCQSLIQEQGGTITIDQTVLNGAHFVIHLPVVE